MHDLLFVSSMYSLMFFSMHVQMFISRMYALMCTKYWLTAQEVSACPGKVWLG